MFYRMECSIASSRRKHAVRLRLLRRYFIEILNGLMDLRIRPKVVKL